MRFSIVFMKFAFLCVFMEFVFFSRCEIPSAFLHCFYEVCIFCVDLWSLHFLRFEIPSAFLDCFYAVCLFASLGRHYRLGARFARAVLEARRGHYRLGARFARATALEALVGTTFWALASLAPLFSRLGMHYRLGARFARYYARQEDTPMRFTGTLCCSFICIRKLVLPFRYIHVYTAWMLYFSRVARAKLFCVYFSREARAKSFLSTKQKNQISSSF